MLSISLLGVFELLVFIATGIVLSKLLKLDIAAMSVLFVMGFFAYFCVYGFFAIPMTLTFSSLSTLSYIVMFVTVVLMVMACVFIWRDRKLYAKCVIEDIKGHSFMGLVLVGALLIQQVLVFTYIDNSADASYYIGKVTTDVYTNTLGQYSPYTGELLRELDSRRIFACFQDYNAVISQFFQIHPLKQSKVIMPQILSLITGVLYYRIGLMLFSDDKKKADLFVGFVVLLDLFSNTIYTNATFFFTRTYEGKSILANILIPALILAFLMLWKCVDQKVAAVLLVLISYSSCVFTASSMLIIPVGLTAGFILWILKRKNWRGIYLYMICVIPNLIVCMEYYLSIKGLISFPIGG